MRTLGDIDAALKVEIAVLRIEQREGADTIPVRHSRRRIDTLLEERWAAGLGVGVPDVRASCARAVARR